MENGEKGPWGERKPGNKPKTPWDYQDSPPDIDAVLRQAQERLGSVFGGKKPPISPSGGGKSAGFVALIALILWLSTGFYRVLPEENAILLTFGKWTATRGEAGLGYHIPWPVQAVMKVNVAFERRVEIGFRDASGRDDPSNVTTESQMLTGDENIVDIHFVSMWRIGDAKKYLFQIRDPETTVKKVAESAMREIVGRSEIQKALTEGRASIEVQTKDLMQKMLDEYQSGIIVNNVQLLRVDPPAPVVDAFDDVQRARADMERTKNEAETYRNDIVPRARGDAQKILQDAGAYQESVLKKAEGEAARFLSVYNSYALSKDVTSQRIYIETMQHIMQSSKKVVTEDGNGAAPILPYLALDRAPPAQAPAKTEEK